MDFFYFYLSIKSNQLIAIQKNCKKIFFKEKIVYKLALSVLGVEPIIM